MACLFWIPSTIHIATTAFPKAAVQQWTTMMTTIYHSGALKSQSSCLQAQDRLLDHHYSDLLAVGFISTPEPFKCHRVHLPSKVHPLANLRRSCPTVHLCLMLRHSKLQMIHSWNICQRRCHSHSHAAAMSLVPRLTAIPTKAAHEHPLPLT